jgi:hypothetical protein
MPMKHIKPIFESLNENIKPRDIVQLNRSGKKYMAIEHDRVSYRSRLPITFMAISLEDLANLKRGDDKSRRIFTIKVRSDSYKIVGKGKEADVELARGVAQAIDNKNAEYKKKNYSKIEWSKNPLTGRGEYMVTTADGHNAFVGDEVVVRFNNGHFFGKIKQIGGTKDGEVIIVFPRRTKGRGINPDRILRKTAAPTNTPTSRLTI